MLFLLVTGIVPVMLRHILVENVLIRATLFNTRSLAKRSEGFLAEYGKQLTCHEVLSKLATNRGLPSLVNCRKFEPSRHWLPPGWLYTSDKSLDSEVTDDALASVTEALIGAFLERFFFDLNHFVLHRQLPHIWSCIAFLPKCNVVFKWPFSNIRFS